MSIRISKSKFMAGRQCLKRLHHGDPIRNAALVYQDYDKSRAISLVSRLLNLERG